MKTLLVIVSFLTIMINQSNPVIATKVLFIHHSTGANIINEGKLREELRLINPNILSLNIFTLPDFLTQTEWSQNLTLIS